MWQPPRSYHDPFATSTKSGMIDCDAARRKNSLRPVFRFVSMRISRLNSTLKTMVFMIVVLCFYGIHSTRNSDSPPGIVGFLSNGFYDFQELRISRKLFCLAIQHMYRQCQLKDQKLVVFVPLIPLILSRPTSFEMLAMSLRSTSTYLSVLYVRRETRF